MDAEREDLCFALGGGGARGAYQVGVLRYLAKRYPELHVPMVTGVSAGGINASHLANHTGNFGEKIEDLVRLWTSLSVEQVFRVDTPALLQALLKWAFQLTLLGGRKHGPRVRGFVDTAPLRRFLLDAYACDGEVLCGIEENLRRGALNSVALATTSYSTGRTISWIQGREFEYWERPQRKGLPTQLTVDHVMASAALPLFFPAVQVEDGWYGDGGIRLHSPLAPAIHLGARRVLAVSTHYTRTIEEAQVPDGRGYPSPAKVAGLLMNAIFLDLLDQDAAHLQRINELLEGLPERRLGHLHQIELFVMRPSVDLGELASDYEPKLPGLFRFLTRRLGTKEARSSDLLSLVMFQHDYLSKLIEIGERDAEARAEELAEFLREES